MAVPLQQDIEWLEHHGVKGQKWGVTRARSHKQGGVEKAVNRKIRKAGATHRANKAARSEKRAFKKEKKEFIKSITPKATTAEKVKIGLDIAAVVLIGAGIAAKMQKNKSLSAARATPFPSHGKDWINSSFMGSPAALRPFVVNSAGIVSR